MEKGEKSVLFPAKLPRRGRYAVSVAYAAGPNRAADVPVTVRHAGGKAELKVNQKRAASPFVFKPLGEFTFDERRQAEVEIRTEGTAGHVMIDAVKWVWLGDATGSDAQAGAGP